MQFVFQDIPRMKYLFVILYILLPDALYAQQPVAGFTANKTAGCSPLTVQFTSTSTGNPTSYNWNFGNSNSSTLQTPSATYVVPGTYTVSLKVSNASGNNTKTQTAYITVYANPVASFNGNPLSGCTPLPVVFTDASTPGNGAINKWTWDFGNGNTSTLRQPTSTFTGVGAFNITLSVRDVNGCENSITKNNYINTSAPFTADFTATGNGSCSVPATVNFTSTVTPSGSYTYLWKFGDNTTSTQANPSKTYTTAGTYTVDLEITAANGCKQTISKTQFVNVGGLKAAFTYTTTSDCAPANITLTNTTTPSPSGLTYQWQLNGGQIKNSQNPNYSLTAKTNQVSLLVQNSSGCKDTISQIITLQDPPTANFTADKDYFCQAPGTVNLTNSSSGGATQYSWNMGNSIGSSAVNPTVTYNSKGSYNIRMIATRPTGCRDTLIKQIIVDEPGVSITDQHKKGGCAPYNVTFDVTDLSYVALTTWKWELNNATVSTTKNFTYTLNTEGIYVFKLTATNPKGCIVTTYDTVKVSPKPLFDFTSDKQLVCYNPGIVTLFYHPTNGVIPDNITWTISSLTTTISRTRDSAIVKLTDTGYYNVTVKASNKGCTNTLTKTNYLRVVPAVAKFKFTIDDCATDTVLFTNQSIGNNRLTWNFDDGGSPLTGVSSPTHVYHTAGTHLVKLVATDTTTGCSDSIMQPVVIILPPQISFTPSDTSICMGASVKITDRTIMDPSRQIREWTYKVSDGRQFTVQNPNIPFTTAGNFTIRLSIKDNKNCVYVSTDTMRVKVYGGRSDFTMSANMGCTPLNIVFTDASQSDNPIVNRFWRWGNGDSLNTPSVNASYSYINAAPNQENGIAATLIITDDKGCSYTSSKAVKPYQPKAQYSYSVKKYCGLDSVFMSPAITTQSVNTPATFKWILPSGTSTVQDSKFSASGDTIIPVLFELKDSLGCTDTITRFISVLAHKPKIGFDGFPRNISCYSDKPTVRLKDTSIVGSGPITSRIWHFGNGNSATITGKGNDTASLIYLKPGKYTVSLQIQDSIGCIDSLTAPDFVVAGGPSGTYSFSPTKGCMPLNVNFKVTTSNAVLFFWDHADGNVDSFTVDTHSYTYNAPRVYYPRLTLVDSSYSCFNGLDAIDSIEVLPLPQPDFSTNLNVICKNGFVSIHNQTAPHQSPITSWRWTFGPNDTLFIKQPGPKQYTTPGVFNVILEATDSNGCYAMVEKDSFVTVNDDTIPPEIPIVKRVTVEDNESVLFEFTPNTEADFAKYIIYTTNNQYTFTQINDTAFTEHSLNTLQNPYSYKMLAIDVCNNISGMSETHTTVELKATGLPNSIGLQWTPYIGFDTSKYYTIWRKNPDEVSFTPLTSVTGNTTSYTDTNTLCNQTYFYRIQTIETDSMLQTSWSDTAGAVPVYVNTLPVPQNIRATVVNNREVLLEWHLAKHYRSFTYHIYKSQDSEPASLFRIISSSDTTLTDTEVNVQEHSYTYTTYLVDACGGTSAPGNIAKTILLNVRMVGNDILTHDPKLTWNPYEKWDLGVNHYVVDFWNEVSGPEKISRNTPDNLETIHRYINLTQAEYCYIVTAFKEGDSSIISESNMACVSTAPRLYAPNVFTINNDKLNDVFYVKGLFVESFSLKIFNRWGELVFETTDINQGWDGTFKGDPCKPDVFVYMAEGTGKRGERVNITGNVTLLR